MKLAAPILFALASVILAAPAAAQSPAAPSVEAPPKPKRLAREPTAKQMMARERQQKCSAEWKAARAAGTTAPGTRWPQFWSACNARLKGKVV